MKRVLTVTLLIALLMLAPSCAGNRANGDAAPEHPAEDPPVPEQPAEERQLKMLLGETKVGVEWQDNDAVAALKELVKTKPLTIRMSMYGGFEQVGPIGKTLPRNDRKMTTGAGDIVLYSGDQIVVFYGSNTWSYTRLGRITGKTKAELKDLLGSGDITLTLRCE